MQTLRDIITSRKSVFPPQYSGQPIPEEVLQEIITAANYAPNHKRTQPWRIKVHKGDEKERLGEELVRLYKKNVPAEQFSERKMNEIAQQAALSDVVLTINIHFSGKVPECCYRYGSTKYVSHLHGSRGRLLLGHTRFYVSVERLFAIRRF